MYQFHRFLPQLAPSRFSDLDFYRALERIGYREILLGPGEPAALAEAAARLKRDTRLGVVIVPDVPAAACGRAEILVARAPGGAPSAEAAQGERARGERRFAASVKASATVIAAGRILHEPVARVLLDDSAGRRCYAAFSAAEPDVLLTYAKHARLHGYHWLVLDFEDPDAHLDARVVAPLKSIAGVRLAVAHAFSPEAAAAALALGVDTVIARAEVFAGATDPLALAAAYHARLLKDDAGCRKAV